jgi:hypothetical protein
MDIVGASSRGIYFAFNAAIQQAEKKKTKRNQGGRGTRPSPALATFFVWCDIISIAPSVE